MDQIDANFSWSKTIIPNVALVISDGPTWLHPGGYGWDQLGTRTSDVDYKALLDSMPKRPIDYFRMFYADTALFGATGATECGLAFFGFDHVLFGTDMPFDPEKGPGFIRETIRVIDSIAMTPSDRGKIYEGNAQRLLKLGKV